jgi:sugar lactone lactonase YvrE
MSHISAIRPPFAIARGRVVIEGGPFFQRGDGVPRVTLGDEAARVSMASRHRIAVEVPGGLPGGSTAVRIADLPGVTAYLEVGQVVATGLHQVDSPVVGPDGSVYLTFSGSRGQQTPVSIFRVRQGGPREVFARGITNATSMAIDGAGRLYVSSRFDGSVFRFESDGSMETVAADLGIACGLAIAPDGTLLVGDRTGTVFRVTTNGETSVLATLPPSVAAFHLALAPSGDLFVTGPTLSTRDALYRISAEGRVEEVSRAFGRPQGLAFDRHGALFVVEALAGVAGLYRLDADRGRRLVLSGEGLVGAVFDADNALVVATGDTAYRFPPLPPG